jgi:tRNA (adenine-N(1)-)-methyltransferase non-catalytic subunit
MTKNNKELVDDNTAQQLTSEQISEMKRKGVDGEKIIQALVEGSTTFQKKTEFSKQKYLRKKKQK